MILSLIRKLHQRRQRMQSIGGLLLRADDHLLDDIGLTRDDLHDMLQGDSQGDGARILGRAPLSMCPS